MDLSYLFYSEAMIPTQSVDHCKQIKETVKEIEELVYNDPVQDEAPVVEVKKKTSKKKD